MNKKEEEPEKRRHRPTRVPIEILRLVKVYSRHRITRGHKKTYLIHKKYRQDVEALYALRQASHIDPEHCEDCAELKETYREIDSTHSRTKENIAYLETLEQEWKELFHQGHKRPSHCQHCASVKARIRKTLNEVALEYRYYVGAVVKNSANLGVDVEDLFQEGLLHLFAAFARYNPDIRQDKAPPTILEFDNFGDEIWYQQEKTLKPEEAPRRKNGQSGWPSFLGNSLRASSRALTEQNVLNIGYIPHNSRTHYQLVRKATRYQEAIHNRTPNAQEIIDHFKNKEKPTIQEQDLTLAHAEEALIDHDYFNPLSLDDPEIHERHLTLLGDPLPASNDHLIDRLQDNWSPTPEDITDWKQLLFLIERALNDIYAAVPQLSHILQQILRGRYQIYGEKPLTLKEVGNQFGLSTERIRQLQWTAEKEFAHLSGFHPRELLALQVIDVLLSNFLSVVTPDNLPNELDAAQMGGRQRLTRHELHQGYLPTKSGDLADYLVSISYKGKPRKTSFKATSEKESAQAQSQPIKLIDDDAPELEYTDSPGNSEEYLELPEEVVPEGAEAPLGLILHSDPEEFIRLLQPATYVFEGRSYVDNPYDALRKYKLTHREINGILDKLEQQGRIQRPRLKGKIEIISQIDLKTKYQHMLLNLLSHI